MSKRAYIGLDLETSGSRHDVHVPIQLGIAMPNGKLFSRLIGGWRWYDPMDEEHRMTPYPKYKEVGLRAWSDEAFGVHGITKEDLETAADRYVVQSQATKFIGENTDAWIGNRIVVGWNVASFDMPFVREFLPAVSNSLSYRSVDLNAVSFTVADALGLSWGNLKRRSKEYAQLRLERDWDEPKWHDAGFDAQAALYSKDYLEQVIRAGDYV